MAKTRCKMKKDERKEASKSENPKFCCKKCGEKVEKKKHVCKPKEIK